MEMHARKWEWKEGLLAYGQHIASHHCYHHPKANVRAVCWPNPRIIVSHNLQSASSFHRQSLLDYQDNIQAKYVASSNPGSGRDCRQKYCCIANADRHTRHSLDPKFEQRSPWEARQYPVGDNMKKQSRRRRDSATERHSSSRPSTFQMWSPPNDHRMLWQPQPTLATERDDA